MLRLIFLALIIYIKYGLGKNSAEVENNIVALQEAVLLRLSSDDTNDFEKTGIEVTCLHNRMCISLSTRFYEENGIAILNLLSPRLNDQCDSEVVSDPNPQNVTLCIPLSVTKCGTNMELNDVNVTYKNTLRMYDIQDTNYPMVVIGGRKDHVIEWQCVYPVEYIVKLKIENIKDIDTFVPTISDVRQIEVDAEVSGIGFGTFPIGMFLYESKNFKNILASNHSYEMDAILYVGVILMEGPRNAFVEARRCWATPTIFMMDSRYINLINDFCAELEFVTIFENGPTRWLKWSSPVFKFINSPSVYMHCEIIICFPRPGNMCNQKDFCALRNVRKRRSSISILDGSDSMSRHNILTIGPIPVRNKINRDHTPSSDDMSEDTFIPPTISEGNNKWILLSVLGVFSALAVLGLIMLLVVKYRSRITVKNS